MLATSCGGAEAPRRLCGGSHDLVDLATAVVPGGQASGQVPRGLVCRRHVQGLALAMTARWPWP